MSVRPSEAARPSQPAFAALGPRFVPLPLRPQFAALPHFAFGGLLPPGGTGMVGDAGPETITALPGGGARIVPTSLPGFTAALAPPAALPMAPAAVGRVPSEQPPTPSDPQYRTSAWRKALAIGAGALAGGLTRNPEFGAEVAANWAPDTYAGALQIYQQQRQQALAGLGRVLDAARLEQGRKQAKTRVW